MSFEVWMLALGIVLLLEGCGPLIFPEKWQAYLQELSRAQPNMLRRIGGALVTAGVVLLVIFS
ncbi:hypothetical protein NFHSH190041_32750 [Shewanella sp. NFH-SH190041]|uniref:DUF2065 domain-containing protein n=1 Tax=Shewanella sp. NFH-SH190041 TaxID=2950245 RepID=UPI0021C32315|nr:DUF2065 domain-containing protein [Shewanella sp. NFH-SH190041]BDM65823.1 hypothetical protein NFHSH190041_32750 [Shewanella sp. NFH-SH190041]